MDFAHHVETNTMRYIKHFEEVADELMPLATFEDKDVYDVLNVPNVHTTNDIYMHIGATPSRSCSLRRPSSAT